MKKLVCGILVWVLLLLPACGNASDVTDNDTKSEADQWRDVAQNTMQYAGEPAFVVYDYLCDIGTFTSSEPEPFGEYDFLTKFEFSFTDELGVDYAVVKAIITATDRTMSYLDSTYYLFRWSGLTDDGYTIRSADICEPDSNTTADSMYAYADYLDWCTSLEIEPDQIIYVLDYYQRQIEKDTPVETTSPHESGTAKIDYNDFLSSLYSQVTSNDGATISELRNEQDGVKHEITHSIAYSSDAGPFVYVVQVTCGPNESVERIIFYTPSNSPNLDTLSFYVYNATGLDPVNAFEFSKLFELESCANGYTGESDQYVGYTIDGWTAYISISIEDDYFMFVIEQPE